MSAIDIKHLLTDWGFKEEVIANFEAQDIEIEQLDILTEDDLKLLIPNIGPRRKFQSKLKKYLCELPAEKEQQTYVINTNPKKKLRSETELNKEDATERQHLNEEAVIEQEHVNEEATTEQQHVNEEAATEQQHVNEEAATEQNIAIITEQEPLHAVITTAQQHSNAVIEPPYFVDLNDDNSYVFELSRSGTPSEHSEKLSTNETTKRGVTHHIYSDYNLEAILKKSDDGLLLLRSYTNEGRLDNDLRNKLAKIIVSNELSSNVNNNITSNRASFLSDQIIKLFPTEEKSVWYIQHKKGQSQGRGKILTKYYATRRKLIKVGLINLKEDQAEAESDLNNDENDDPLRYEEYFLWLKNNSKPWQKVLDYWSLTSKKRMKALLSDKQPCHEYMSQFPALSDPLGYLLLEIDFETLHPERNLKLYLAWPKLSAFIIDKVKSKAKKRLDDVSTADGSLVATLSLIPHLFPVITVKKGQPRNWRPSREECEEGFLLHVRTIADLEAKLHERTVKLKSFGLTSQPIAVIVGPTFDEITQCFVVINKYRYEMETPLKAVDFVLKTCNALNVRYPFEVGQAFMFLQRAVYDFETAWDRQKNSQFTAAVLATTQEFKIL